MRDLGAFGHRGSATDHERRAADSLVLELRRLGLDPATEPFAGSRSHGGRFLIHVGVAALGVGCLWVFPAATVALGVAALGSLWAEQSTRGVWLSRPLVRFASGNIVARLTPPGPIRRRLIVSGHYDTQRTGLIWSVLSGMGPLVWPLPAVLKPPGLALAGAMVLQIVVGFAAIRGRGPAVGVAGWALLAVYGLVGLLLGQLAVGRFVPGAADNASGVAAVLAVGEAWHRAPVDGVELVVLLTGCEETGLLGAVAWADRHRAEIRAIPTLFLNLDGLGFGPPRFLGWEVPGVGLPVAPPRSILSVAAAVAAEQGLEDAGPHSLPGPTDGLAFLKRGLPGLTVVGFRGRGHLPNYHRMSDAPDAVDFESAFAGVEFALGVLRRFAAGAGDAESQSGRV